jgi:hypothetical protein
MASRLPRWEEGEMSDLEQVARFLGEPYYFWKGTVPYLGLILHRHSNRPTEGDLLLALLERAAEVNPIATPVLWKHPHAPLWCFKMWPKGRDVYYEYTIVEEGPTPLAAMTAAVVKYMEAQK